MAVDARQAFAQLKPVCVEVMRAPSVEALGRVDDVLRDLRQLTPPLVEYALLPLRMAIRRAGGSDPVLLEAILKTLFLVFSRVPHAALPLSWEVFQELFVFLSMLLDSKMAGEAGYGSPGEERALRTAQALGSLLLCVDERTVSQLYLNLPAIGHCVSVLLASLQCWPSKPLQRASLIALLALAGLGEEEVQLFTGTDLLPETVHSLKALLWRIGMEEGGGGGVKGEGGERGGGKRGGGEGMGYKGKVLASFLPGVTMAICKLVTTDPNIGQGVTNLSLLTWAHYVCLVMADRNYKEEEEEEGAVMGSAAAPSAPGLPSQALSPPTQGGSLAVEPSRRWREETDRRLSLLAHRMAVLVTSEGWRVRRGVVLWAHCLLGHCHRTLVTMVPTLLETLVTLSHDDYEQVATCSQCSLEAFSSLYAESGHRQLTSLLEERLHALASSLPRLMRQHDDTRKVSTLQLLAGYLKLLGCHTISLTHSHLHLSRLTQALVQTLELDVSDCRVLEELPQGEGGLEGEEGRMQGEEGKVWSEEGKVQGEEERVGREAGRVEGEEGKVEREKEERWWSLVLRYRHFRLLRIETLLQHCIQLLGSYGSLPVLLDHLLEAYRNSAHHRKELLILIGHALIGAGGRGCVHGREKPPHAVGEEEMCALVEGVLEEVTADNWGERGGGGGNTPEEEEEGVLPASSILLSCLQLCVVGVCVHLLGPSFLPHLQTMAYLLLQRAGSRSPEVTSQALATLHTVTSYSGRNSLSDLITQNADYLVNSVALQLRSSTHKHEALHVLQAVLGHGGAEVLPLMMDSIQELFLSLDLHLLPAEGVWPVLQCLSTALHRWAPPPPNESVLGAGRRGGGGTAEAAQPAEEERREEVGPEDVRQFFVNYHRQKEIREAEEEEGRREGEEEREEEGGSGEDITPSSKKMLPPADQAAVDVLQRCLHFLPSPSPSLQLTVLDSLTHCLCALRHNHEALLPEVHKVWPAFAPRLSDPSPPVALRALEVLWTMCEVCGDFVRRRVVKGVWPSIAHYLENMVSDGLRADHLYCRTVKCRLQLKLLETVRILPELLQIGSEDLERLAQACLPYLNEDQPEPLQEACQTSLTALIRLDPDCMWLLLHQLIPSEPTAPPHPSLPPYRFGRFPDSDKFSAKVRPLLRLTLT